MNVFLLIIFFLFFFISLFRLLHLPCWPFYSHQIQATTNNKITVTSKDLQRLTAVVRRGDKQQRLQVEKLTSDFKIVVDKYSSSQRQIASKMKLYVTSVMNLSQHDDEQQQQQQSDGMDDRERLVQEQKRLENELKFEQSMLKEREIRFQQIEADILDVNLINRELSSLINQQGQVIGESTRLVSIRLGV